ncbi:intradiol ring-cleavage dioxygenase [Nitrospirillum sp. BR 11828]|uniref:intradiol ring-cleavage dioxygenase n=1 Tax=Nitrospirillum sp. BR 11828 TaxID=3104325 RepID=UPI002ACA95F9|nr:intradiol ring-cleavage dioxygenase [Nitrospirillum sp. BR 11828]MDZ5648752.1 intradiol ring-cleavage dioxygenase [Nitrospirillum sp. BR 11828]
MSAASLSRRQALTRLATAGTGVALAGVPASAATAPGAAARIPMGTLCRMTPQSIEGPYYIDPRLVRSDIREGKAGVPLTVRFQVLNGADCAPLPGARVDIWHADATGVYSGYDHQGAQGGTDTRGQTFLRGTQMADADGGVSFRTIYPGWYAGRTTHLHFKVFLDSRTVLMAQMYFPDALSEFLYTTVRPYCDRGQVRDMVNATDPVAASDDGDHACYAAVKEEKDGYVASLTLGVDRQGQVKADFGPGGPGGPPPPGAPNGVIPKDANGRPLPPPDGPPNGSFAGGPPPGGPGRLPPGSGPFGPGQAGPRQLVPGVALADQQGKSKT